MKIQIWVACAACLLHGNHADAEGRQPSTWTDDDSSGWEQESHPADDTGDPDMDEAPPVRRHLRAHRNDEEAVVDLPKLREKLNQEYLTRKHADSLAEKLTATLKNTTGALRKSRAEAAALRDELKGKAAIESELAMLKKENKRLATLNKQTKKNLDEVRDHVDEAEAARKTKTEELSNKIAEMADLRKKEQLDIAAIRLKDQEAQKDMMKHMKEDQKKQQASFETQQQQSKAVIHNLTKKLSALDRTSASLKDKIKQEEAKVKTAEGQTRKTTEKLKAEHQALAAAQREIAKLKQHVAARDAEIKTLKEQADRMNKAQQQIEALALASSALNQTKADRQGALDTTITRLEDEGKELSDTHKKLKATSAMLKQSQEAKRKADARANRFWQALKQQKARVQTHDEELEAIEKQLNATAEQKNVLVQELVTMQSKMAEIARRDQDIATVRSQLSHSQDQLKSKDQDLDSMRQKLKACADKDQESKALNAKVAAANAEEKEVADKLAAAEHQIADETNRRKAEKQEMDAILAEAKQAKQEMMQKLSQELLEKEKELKEVRDAEAKAEAARAQETDVDPQAQDTIDQESDTSDGLTQVAGKHKASLLSGKSVMRSQHLERDLVNKDLELKAAQTQVESMKAAMKVKDMELEEARQAVLHSAQMQLPPISAVEVAAAKTALEKVDGKLTTEEHELNATKVELEASTQENTIRQQEMQVLKDEHIALGNKVKKLSAALIKEYASEKQLRKAFSTLEAKENATAEHSKQDSRSTASRQETSQQSIGSTKAQKTLQQNAASAEETQRAVASVPKVMEPSKVSAPSIDESDDDDDDDKSDSDSDDESFAESVPWDNVQKVMSSNMKIISAGAGQEKS